MDTQIEPAVVTKNVSVVLGDSYTALQRVSIELPKGKIIGFIGPSGAGKTTLIRVLVGRQKITKGIAQILGVPAGSVALRSQVSYMTQENSIYPDLTVYQNLRYFARMFGLKRRETRSTVEQLIKTIDLTKHAHQLVSQLSGGQKQRVSLAVAFIGNPKLMILDEPTVGLDPVLRQQMWQLFRSLTGNGTTIIISSHVMDEADRCDDLVLIRNGSVLAHASPKELCRQANAKTIEESFLKFVERKK